MPIPRAVSEMARMNQPEQREKQMGAREKLNAAHAVGNVIIAAIVGCLFESFFVFFIAAAVLIAAALNSGDIRPKPRSPR